MKQNSSDGNKINTSIRVTSENVEMLTYSTCVGFPDRKIIKGKGEINLFLFLYSN